MIKANNACRGYSRFFGMLLFLLLLIAIRYSFQIDIPRFLFIVLIAMIAMFGNKSEIIAICVCCIPLHESIDLFYSLVICVCIYVVKFYKQIRINHSVILVLIMILWELLHCFVTEFSVVDFITDIVPWIVLAVMMCSDVSDVDYPLIVRAFSVATLGVCLILFGKVLYLSGFNVQAAVSGLQRLGLDTEEAGQSIKVTGGEVNPNTLGIIGVLAVGGLMQIRNINQGRTSDIFVACIIVIFGALTASRTYLVCLVLMVVLLVMSQSGSFVRKLRFIGLLTLLGLLALLVLNICFPDLLEYYISRFFVKDITTGRGDLMTLYHRFIASDPLILFFGIGLQNFGYRLTEVYRVATTVPHNAIQEIVVVWGLPGVFLIAALILWMYHASTAHCSKQGLINSIPLLILLIKCLAGQMLGSAYTMLALSYAYLSLCTDLHSPEGTGIFTRTYVLSRDSGLNINQLRRKTNK